jgi:hypothetical protein
MFKEAGTVLRADINMLVEEAANAEKFLIGNQVVPPVMVSAQSGQYPYIAVEGGELLTAGSVDRNPDGSYGEVSRSLSSDTYACQDRGLEERVDDANKADLARYFALEALAGRLTLRNVMLAAEVRKAAVIMNASNFTATAAVVSHTVTNIATFDFPLDVLNAIDRCEDDGNAPNTIVISSPEYNLVVRGTKTLAFVKGSVGAAADINADSLQLAFAKRGITKILVGAGRVNTAKKGQTRSVTKIWGNTYIWVGQVNPNANVIQDMGGAAFELVWNAEGGQYVTETYRDESRRSNMVRVRQNTIEKVVNTTAGQLITTSYSLS